VKSFSPEKLHIETPFEKSSLGLLVLPLTSPAMAGSAIRIAATNITNALSGFSSFLLRWDV